VRGVDDDGIDAGFAQRSNAIECVGRGTDGSADTQSAARVLAGAWALGRLLDIFDGDEPLELVVVTDYEHFLDAVLVEELQHVFARRVLAYRDQTLLGRHHRSHWIVELGLEAQIATGDDAHDLLALHHRHA